MEIEKRSLPTELGEAPVYAPKEKNGERNGRPDHKKGKKRTGKDRRQFATPKTSAPSGIEAKENMPAVQAETTGNPEQNNDEKKQKKKSHRRYYRKPKAKEES